MSDPDDGGDRATVLARRMAALPETGMRQHALRKYLETVKPGSAVAVLDQIRRRGNYGGPPYDVTLLALAALLNGGQLSYARLAELYDAAKEQSRTGLLDLFFSPLTPTETPTRKVERELTLGHRKTLARTGDRTVLNRLLRQPESEVIPHVLQNSRITELDVVRVAARRPTDPEIQRLLAGTPRWIVRYRVKKALVLNPHTPSDVSLRLLPFLRHTDLRQVQTTTGLPEALRNAADRLLTQ